MSTWTFDRATIKVAVFLILVVGLASCGQSRFRGKGNSDRKAENAGYASGSSRSQTSTITLAGKDIVIKGPQGFCLDRETSQVSGSNAFVLLGNCTVVSPRSRAPAPRVKALLTATFSAPAESQGRIAGTGDSLDAFFRSDTGRAALSRESDAKTVEILDTVYRDDTFYLRARDTSEGVVPKASDDYWRAYFDFDDRIASVSVIGFRDAPLPPDKGLDTVREFAALIKSENGLGPAPAPLPPEDTIAAAPADTYADTSQADEPLPAESKRKRKLRTGLSPLYAVGILRRIMH